MIRLLAVFTCLLLASAALAGDSERERRSMKGRHGVMVLVESLGDAEGIGGLFERDIQTDVELALRTAGIRVWTAEETFKLAPEAYLYVDFNILFTDDGLAVYSLVTSLCQTVRLWDSERLLWDGERARGVPTWSLDSVGFVGRSNLWTLRQSAKDNANRFANAWLSVNPN